MKRSKTILITFILLFIALTIIVNNCSFIRSEKPVPELLAHRGLAQTFDIKTVKWNTNTAGIIHKPEYEYIENTIPSISIAFKYGADIVEFDIRVTKDKQLAVFHDSSVGYRTEKKGNICDYTMDELKHFDVGYGYTHDNGLTYPLRGKGVGLMPSFEDVLSGFKGKKFLIHIRDDGPEIGNILLSKLEILNENDTNNISIYGNDEAVKIIRSRYPKMLALSKSLMIKGLIEYEIIGWTGIIPESMKYLEIHLPVKYAKYLWGWPVKLSERVRKADSRFVLVTSQGEWSGGFDTSDDIKQIPEGYNGCIWTDRIDLAGKIYKKY